MNTKLPLQLYLLAHPASEKGKSIAKALMHRFVEPPASGGLRVPVRFTPDRGDDLPPGFDEPDGMVLGDAEHSIVVVLADQRMARTAGGGTGAAWAAFIREAIEATPVGRSPHHVIPVALDEDGFRLGGDWHVLGAQLDSDLDPGAASAKQIAEISLHVAARAIQLLDNGCVQEERPDQLKAPVRLFISHAKADLSEARDDPARQTMDSLAELPIEYWYDAAKIGTSQRFDKAIEAGIRDSTVMIAFHTDHYGSRPWCRREVLAAKEKGVHLLVVDALRDGEARRFPYMGNAPSIRWRFDEPGVDARRVVNRAILETLRSKFNRALLEQRKQGSDVVLASPPEVVTLAYDGIAVGASQTYLYPDPPLTREELDLLHRVAPNAKLVTPLTRLAKWTPPDGLDQVAVSISKSNDIERYGLSDSHQQTLSDEIHLYLLLAGVRIGYGGSLKGNFEDAENFTLRLFELVRGYAKLAEQVKAGAFHPIVNYIPWPLILDYGDADWALFGHEATDEQCPRPPLATDDATLFPSSADGWRLTPKTARQRYAWARGLTLMRERMSEKTQARIVIGGSLEQFLGLVPGVIEEAWMSLTKHKPLYLVGAFGGCARAVSDQLAGEQRPEFTDDQARNTVDGYDAVVQHYRDDAVGFVSIAQMGAEIAARGREGLAVALANGLNAAENQELIRCSNPTRIAELVLRGLSQEPWKTSAQ